MQMLKLFISGAAVGAAAGAVVGSTGAGASVGAAAGAQADNTKTAQINTAAIVVPVEVILDFMFFLRNSLGIVIVIQPEVSCVQWVGVLGPLNLLLNSLRVACTEHYFLDNVVTEWP